MAENSYTGIKTLEGLAGVRARLSMYLDSTGVVEEGRQPLALTQMMQEVVSNALDERLAGYGSEVDVIIHDDGSMEVKDEGRGMPKGPGKSFDDAMRALTVAHSSGKFDEGSYAALGTAGMNGIGIKAVNAGSKKIIVHAISHETREDAAGHKELTGKLEEWELELHLEEVISEKLIRSGIKDDGKVKTGTSVRFWPDDGPISDDNPKRVLESAEWVARDLKPVLDASAVLMPGLKVTLTDERGPEPKSWAWLYEDGLSTYVEALSEGSPKLKGFEKPVRVSGMASARRGDAEHEMSMDVAFIPTDTVGCTMKAFANGVPTPKGGPHLDGLKSGIAKAVNEFSQRGKLVKQKLEADDVLDGMVIAFEMRVPAAIAEFEGQTKGKLSTAQARPAAAEIIYEELSKWLSDNEQLGKALVERARESLASRDAALKARAEAREARKAKAGDGKLLVSSKLKSCLSKDPKERELYLTEGDSASNIGRDPKFQAVMPLRGKILNVMKPKVTLARAKENVEISTIISVLGAGVTSTFNPDDLQYHKVIMCCFTGDTKVKCLDGKSYTFEELVENGQKDIWVYSMDKSGNVVPGHGHSIRVTGSSKKLIEITLDNGSSFKCTPDHLLMDVNGKYVKAEDIREGDSLMPIHFRHDILHYEGYESFYDRNTRRWKMTHRMVAESLLEDEMKSAFSRAREGCQSTSKRRIHVHHKDNDKLNNDPENLVWLTPQEHVAEHGGWSSYNGSDAQRAMLKKAHRDGKMSYEGFKAYNASGRSSEVAKRVNAMKKHIDSVNMSKVAKSISFLLQNGLPVDEYHYDFYKMPGTRSYSKITDIFDSVEDAIKYAIDNGFEPGPDYMPSCEYSFEYDNDKKQRQQIANVMHKLISNGEDVNEKTYTGAKSVRTVTWDNILKWFDSYDEAIEYSKNYNHCVKSVKAIELDEPVKVYDLTVDTHHNFLLDNGVIAHQCDGDGDGKHIMMLLTGIFWKLFPGLIENGNLYYVNIPLYRATKYVKGELQEQLFYSEAEYEAHRSEVEGWKLSRFKGLGEIDNVDDARAMICDPETRRLVQVEIGDAVEAQKALNAMLGDDASLRYEFIEGNVDFDVLGEE